MMRVPTISYKNHRFSPQIIAHAVWLYFRFPLSLRLMEEMLLERCIVVSYQTIRRWGRKFRAAFRSAGGLQRFISVFSAVRNHFVPAHQQHSALATHIHRIRAMAQWKVVTGAHLA